MVSFSYYDSKWVKFSKIFTLLSKIERNKTSNPNETKDQLYYVTLNRLLCRAGPERVLGIRPPPPSPVVAQALGLWAPAAEGILFESLRVLETEMVTLLPVEQGRPHIDRGGLSSPFSIATRCPRHLRNIYSNIFTIKFAGSLQRITTGGITVNEWALSLSFFDRFMSQGKNFLKWDRKK